MTGVKLGQFILAAAATIPAAETAIGSTIRVGGNDTLTLYCKYTKGDETGVYITIYYLDIDGNEFKDADWSSASGDRTYTVNRYYLTATTNAYIQVDVSGMLSVIVKLDANAGTPTGTMGINYDLTRKS